MITKKQVVAWNNEMFIKYNNIRMYEHINPIIRYTENKRITSILSYIHFINGSSKILDLGCGEGYITKKIQDNKKDVVLVSVDMSNHALMTGLRLGMFTSHLISRLDAESVPFKNNSFHCVVCTELIEHTINPSIVLSEIDRVLIDDGIAVLTIPNEPMINKVKLLLRKLGCFNLLLKDVPKDMTKEWHLHSFDLKLFKNMIKNTNLKIININATPSNVLPIRYIIKCKKIRTI